MLSFENFIIAVEGDSPSHRSNSVLSVSSVVSHPPIIYQGRNSTDHRLSDVSTTSSLENRRSSQPVKNPPIGRVSKPSITGRQKVLLTGNQIPMISTKVDDVAPMVTLGWNTTSTMSHTRQRRIHLRQFTTIWEQTLMNESREWACLIDQFQTRQKRSTPRIVRQYTTRELRSGTSIWRWYQNSRSGKYGLKALRNEVYQRRQQKARQKIEKVKSIRQLVEDELIVAQQHDVEELKISKRGAFKQREQTERNKIIKYFDKSFIIMIEQRQFESANFRFVKAVSKVVKNEFKVRIQIEQLAQLCLSDYAYKASLEVMLALPNAAVSVEKISCWWLQYLKGIFNKAVRRIILSNSLRVARELRFREARKQQTGYVENSQRELLSAVGTTHLQPSMLLKANAVFTDREQRMQSWLSANEKKVSRLRQSILNGTDETPLPLPPVHQCFSFEISPTPPVKRLESKVGLNVRRRSTFGRIRPLQQLLNRDYTSPLFADEEYSRHLQGRQEVESRNQITLIVDSFSEKFRTILTERNARNAFNRKLQPMKIIMKCEGDSYRARNSVNKEETYEWSALRKAVNEGAEKAFQISSDECQKLELNLRTEASSNEQLSFDLISKDCLACWATLMLYLERKNLGHQERDERDDLIFSDSSELDILIKSHARKLLRLLSQCEEPCRGEITSEEVSQRVLLSNYKQQVDSAILELKQQLEDQEIARQTRIKRATKHRALMNGELDRRTHVELVQDVHFCFIADKRNNEVSTLFNALLLEKISEEEICREKVLKEVCGIFDLLWSDISVIAATACSQFESEMEQRRTLLEQSEANQRGSIIFNEDQDVWFLSNLLNTSGGLTDEKITSFILSEEMGGRLVVTRNEEYEWQQIKSIQKI